MRCVLLVLLLNLVAASPVPPPTRQANGRHGCTRICMGMWGVSIVRICVEIKVVVPYTTRLPGSYAEAWEYVLAGGMSVFKCIINKKIPMCSGTIGASGITVNCPHDMPSFCPADRFLLLLFFDLQQQSSQENKDVVSTVNLSFASSALWKMSHWFALCINDNWISHTYKRQFNRLGCNLKIGSKAEVIRNKLTCSIEASPYDRGECLYTNEIFNIRSLSKCSVRTAIIKHGSFV